MTILNIKVYSTTINTTQDKIATDHLQQQLQQQQQQQQQRPRDPACPTS